jgi:protein phosphatase
VSAAEQLRISVGGITDIGPVRDANEDHLLIDIEYGLFAVFDASGRWEGPPSQVGQFGGEIIQRIVRAQLSTGVEPRSLLEHVFRTAKDSIQAEPVDSDRYGGAVVVLALLQRDVIYVSWLGDGMAHRVSGEKIEPLNWTHTLRNVMLRMGTLTEADDARSPRLTIVQVHYLGGELPDPLEVISFTPKPGDRLFLTTDGVHSDLLGSDFVSACQTHPNPQACANRLVALARERGSRDNATCVVIAFG